ncbi:MAG: serine/threonine protein kinase [Planctomycetaceae bacterium]
MEPPSKQLVSLLTGLGLCTASDLRRSRSRVRRLARDLPAFDSVWIDALVQARKLTTFQAHLLETSRPELLKIGPCVIVERLGTSESSETFLSEIIERHERCVLKRLRVSPDQCDQAGEELKGLVEKLSHVSHPSIAGPFTVQRQQEQLFALAPYIPGPHLGDLLIRRGRFPTDVVAAIARQLLDGLCALEKAGCIHGDILLSNVRCLNSGRMVLVDTGITPIVHPRISYYDDASPERYDGMAPELIGPGRNPDAQSDVYALGCLLWQLLTARPPYIQADPLLKLAAHQMQTIEDVRTWVPDTPAFLAEGINRCISRSLSERPSSFQQARELFGLPARRDAHRLKVFRSMFQSRAVPLRGHSPVKPGGWAWMCAILFLISGVATSLFHSGIRTELLSLTQQFQPAEATTPNETTNVTANATTAGTPTETQSHRWMPLPRPDAAGVIKLDAAGPYAAAEIVQVGKLSIVASADRPAVIIVEEQPLMVSCEAFHLENVELRFGDDEATAEEKPSVDAGQSTATEKASALLLVQAQDISIQGCRFISDVLPSGDISFATRSTATSTPRPAIGWKLVDPSDPQAGLCSLTECVFAGDGVSVYLKDIPHQLSLTNVFKQGEGALLQLKRMPTSKHALDVQLKSVTCRQSGPIFKIMLSDAQSRRLAGAIRCTAENSVFDFISLEQGEITPFIEFVENDLPANWHERIELTGQGNLANPQLVLAALRSPSDGQQQVLDDSEMSVEGLSTAEIKFLEPAGLTVKNAAIEPPSIPSLSSLPPGIDSERMPVWLRE